MCKPLAGGEEERLSAVWLGKYFWFNFLPHGREMVIRTHTFCGVGADKQEFWIMDPARPERRRPVCLDLRKLLHPDERRWIFCTLGSSIPIFNTALSRDGRFLAFNLRYMAHGSYWNASSRYHLFVTDLQTGDIAELGDNEEGARLEDISADGGQILFTTQYGHDLRGDRLDPSNLWIINRDGSGLRNIPLDFSAVAAQGPTNDLESLRQAPPMAKP